MDLNTKNCFIDLHLHLDGSLSHSSVKELCRLQGLSVPDDLFIKKNTSVGEGCKDLNEYLTKFDFPLSLLQTKEALSLAFYNLAQELLSDGLIYAEIRFAPQLHLQKGLTQDKVIAAALEGVKKSSLCCSLILCTMRGNNNREENLQTVYLAKEFLNAGVCAVDLAGAEGIFPTQSFKEIFDLAKKLNVPFTIHAGEAKGPSSITTALDFGAKRIGHGVRCIEDISLMKRLEKEGIFLELCPTSNINTGIFKSLEDYPVKLLLNNNIRVTVNCDNMTVSDTNVKKEFIKLYKLNLLSCNDIKTVLCNSADAAFASAQTKKLLKEKIFKEFAD